MTNHRKTNSGTAPVALAVRVSRRPATSGGWSTSAQQDSGWRAAVGAAIHQVIGDLAPLLGEAADDDLTELILDRTAAVAIERKIRGRRDRTNSAIVGAVSMYLQYWVPQGGEFLGAEVPTGTGRIDVVWRIPGLGVLYDEIKCWRTGNMAHSPDVLAQVERYRRHGLATHGDDFVGVRLTPVLNPHHAAVLLATHEWVRPWGPLAYSAGAA